MRKEATTRMKFEIGFGADFALLKPPADRLADGTRALLNLMINITRNIRLAMSSGALKTIAKEKRIHKKFKVA